MAIPILKMVTIGLLPSPLKVAWYRLRGARIGKRVSIGALSVIDARSIDIGDDTRIGLLSFISLKGALRLGKRVNIRSMVAVETGSLSMDDDSILMEQVIIAGMLTPRSEISIGKRVKVFAHAFLNPTEPIVIEDDVGIGGAAYIFTHGSWQNVLDGFHATFAPVRIKKGAWLSWRVFVQPGVTIGEHAIIGPAAVVTQSVPDLGVASGVPAEIRDMKGRHVRKLSAAQREKLVCNILLEYAEYQSWLGEDCRVVSANKTALEIEHSGRRIVLAQLLDYAAPTPKSIVVSLEPLDAAARLRLSSVGSVWFDLAGKESVNDRSEVVTELRNYFSRYGIRFELLDT